jgi:hypothetical protein
MEKTKVIHPVVVILPVITVTYVNHTCPPSKIKSHQSKLWQCQVQTVTTNMLVGLPAFQRKILDHFQSYVEI